MPSPLPAIVHKSIRGGKNYCASFFSYIPHPRPRCRIKGGGCPIAKRLFSRYNHKNEVDHPAEDPFAPFGARPAARGPAAKAAARVQEAVSPFPPPARPGPGPQGAGPGRAVTSPPSRIGGRFWCTYQNLPLFSACILDLYDFMRRHVPPRRRPSPAPGGGRRWPPGSRRPRRGSCGR